jgi:DUF3102 family protein
MTGDNRLPALAGEIEAAHQRCKAKVRDALEAALAAGKALNEARELVPHGQWQDWLKANVPDVSIRTAQRYMKAAEKAKNDTVSFSSLRELIRPTRRPREARTRVFGEVLTATAKDGSPLWRPAVIGEPWMLAFLRDAHAHLEPYRWRRLLWVLRSEELLATAQRAIELNHENDGPYGLVDWATLSDPENWDDERDWTPVLYGARYLPDLNKSFLVAWRFDRPVGRVP